MASRELRRGCGPRLGEEISEDPCYTGNREGFGGFAPIGMAVGTFKKKWYPDNQAKEQEHQGQQASGEKRHPIRKKSHSREREESSRRYGPKHLTWRKPFRDKGGGRGKIKSLFESKGSSADAEKNAADAIPRFLRPCG